MRELLPRGNWGLRVFQIGLRISDLYAAVGAAFAIRFVLASAGSF
jgi:hypothetical protein